MMVPIAIEGTPGVVGVDHGRVMGVFRLDERNGTIYHLSGFVRRPSAPRMT